MLKLIFRGVTWTPPPEFVAEILRLIGVDEWRDVTDGLLKRLGFRKGE